MSNGSAIKAGRAFVEFFADDSNLVKGIRSAEKQVREFGQKVNAIGKQMAGVGAAVLAPLGLAVTQFAARGDQLDKMSLRTGVAAENLSTLGFAAERNGSSLEKLGMSLFMMNRNIANATTSTGPAVRALRELGLNVNELASMPADKQMKLLADALKNVKNPALAAQYAFEVMGDGARDLLPLLKQGSAGIEELQAVARSLGIEMSQGDAAKAAELTDSMGDLKSAVSGVSQVIGGALAQTLIEYTNSVKNSVVSLGRFVNEHRELVVTLAKVAAVVGGVGTAMLSFNAVMNILASTMNNIPIVLGAIRSAVNLTTGSMTALATASLGVKLALAGIVTAGVTGLVIWLASLAKGADETTKAIERLKAAVGGIDSGLNQASSARARGVLAETPEEKKQAVEQEIQAYKNTLIELQKIQDESGRSLISTGQVKNLASGLKIPGLADGLTPQEGLLADKFGKSTESSLTDTLRSIPGGLATGRGGQEFFNIREGGQGFDVSVIAKRIKDQMDDLGKRASELADQVKRDVATAGPDAVTQSLLDEIQQIKTRSIEDPLARELALTELHYAKMKDDAQGQSDKLLLIFKARSAALLEIQDRYLKQSEAKYAAEDERRLQEAQRTAESVVSTEQSIQDQIERLAVQATTRGGAAQERKLLELERSFALRDATASGVSPELVNSLYDLRQEVAAGARAGSESARLGVSGSYNADVLSRLGGNQDVPKQTLEATKETTRYTKEVVNLIRQGQLNPGSLFY